MKLLIKFILPVLILLGNFSPVAAEVSTVGSFATLYSNGHPRNNLAGQIFGITSYNNFLYVSWHYLTDPEIDRNEEIHIWDISNPAESSLIGVMAFPGLFEGGQQELNSPRSLAVIKGHLVFWSANRLYVYKINQNGTLTEQLVDAFIDNLNPDGTGVFDIKGNYASTLRTMLSNNEFLQNQDEDRLQDYALINLQDPTDPFLETLSRAIGKKLLFMDGKITGTFKGLPVSINLSQDAENLDITTFALRRSQHYRRFWKAPLQNFLGRRNLNIPLSSLTNRAISALDVRVLNQRIFERFLKALRLGPNYDIVAAISAEYADDVTIQAALSDYDIEPDDSVQLALEKIIEKVVNANFDQQLDTLLGEAFLSAFQVELLGGRDRSIRTLKKNLRGTFNKALTGDGLEQYLVNSILSPLVDDHPLLRARLNDVINEIADSPIGSAASAALRAFHFFFPTAAIRAGLPFDTPACFAIPRSSRELLRKLLIEAGPELNPRGLALFELIKLMDFYTGNGNYRRLRANLDNQIKALHRDLSTDLVDSVFSELNILANNGVKASQAFKTLAESIDFGKAISRSLASVISEQLLRVGIDPDQSVAELFNAHGLYIDPVLVPPGESLSTIADLKAILNDLELANLRLANLFRRAGLRTSSQLTNLLQALGQHLLNQLFGPQSNLTSLDKALEQLVSTKVSGKLMGDFVSGTLNQALALLNAGTPVPDVFGSISLARRGDCIAQWQLALTAMEAAAAGSAVFSNVVVVIQAAYDNLTNAYQSVLNFVIESLLEQFVAEILNTAVSDYASWMTRPTLQSIELPIDQLLDAATETIVPFSYQRYMGVLATDATAFRNFGPNLPASIVIFDPENLADTKVSLAAGEWLAIDHVRHLDGSLLIQGTKTIDQEPVPVVLLVHLNNRSAQMRTIIGALAEDITFAEHLSFAGGGQILALASLDGKVFLLQTGKVN